jgi:nitrite reductase (NADH) small subunit
VKSNPGILGDMNARITRTRWVDVCSLDDIDPDRSQSVDIGRLQLAVHRSLGDAVYAFDSFDPFSKAYVLSRGLVDEAEGGEPRVASPLNQQHFSLLTGECLDDPNVRVGVYPARVREGRVELQVAATTLDSFESLEVEAFA